MSRVYIGNLDPRVTERELENEFRVFGVIRSYNRRRSFEKRVWGIIFTEPTRTQLEEPFWPEDGFSLLLLLRWCRGNTPLVTRRFSKPYATPKVKVDPYLQPLPAFEKIRDRVLRYALQSWCSPL
ncbi:hypothetical protein CASFOL_038460 [Castilleja foliolosa]|uniref:RRM domain-containing protein n=1 Tax=Castilleja foliolosa TaxID=1961234 RepID=A0ABD3BLN7_9LAMI